MPQQFRKMKPKKASGEESRSLKFAWIVGAVGLSILLVAGIAIATGGTGSKKKSDKRIMAQGETTTPSTTPATGSVPTTTLTIEDVAVPPLSIYRRRNPFEPLVNLEGEPSGVTTLPEGGSRVVSVPPELRSGSRQTPATVSVAITLDGINKQGDKVFARLRVGDQVYDNVPVGGTFAEHYKLLSVSGEASATILFGDERFTIFTGQSIYI